MRKYSRSFLLLFCILAVQVPVLTSCPQKECDQCYQSVCVSCVDGFGLNGSNLCVGCQDSGCRYCRPITLLCAQCKQGLLLNSQDYTCSDNYDTTKSWGIIALGVVVFILSWALLSLIDKRVNLPRRLPSNNDETETVIHVVDDVRLEDEACQKHLDNRDQEESQSNREEGGLENAKQDINITVEDFSFPGKPRCPTPKFRSMKKLFPGLNPLIIPEVSESSQKNSKAGSSNNDSFTFCPPCYTNSFGARTNKDDQFSSSVDNKEEKEDLKDLEKRYSICASNNELRRISTAIAPDVDDNPTENFSQFRKRYFSYESDKSNSPTKIQVHQKIPSPGFIMESLEEEEEEASPSHESKEPNSLESSDKDEYKSNN